MSKIQLILETTIIPDVTVRINDRMFNLSVIKDEYNNIMLIVESDLDAYNQPI